MKHNYVVYRHIFPNGKSYIGITCAKPVSRRWRGGSGYKGQPKIYNAILKYGWENTEHEILVDNVTFSMAKKLERKFIKEYNSIKKGYNITEGGEGTKGKKCSEETKAKISAANKGKPNLNGTNNLKKYQKEYGSWNKGKKLKGEHYRKIVEERKKRCNKERKKRNQRKRHKEDYHCTAHRVCGRINISVLPDKYRFKSVDHFARIRQIAPYNTCKLNYNRSISRNAQAQHKRT